jgi:hypothetical protein
MKEKKNYHFEYVDENQFKKIERSVRKYNMLAYKKLIFEYYSSIREGKFLGKLVSTSKKDKTKSYELKLPTDALFSKVHGDMVLHYTVYEDSNVVLLTNITPDSILEEGHRIELSTYKGVMISKNNAEKDIFKVNLLNIMNNK